MMRSTICFTLALAAVLLFGCGQSETDLPTKVAGNYSYKELSSVLEQNKNAAANEQIGVAKERIEAEKEQALTNLVLSFVNSNASMGGIGSIGSALQSYAASQGLTAPHGSDLVESHAKKIMLAANQQDIETQRQEQAAAQADDSAKTSDDRTDRIRASIQQFLDIIRSMNPQI